MSSEDVSQPSGRLRMSTSTPRAMWLSRPSRAVALGTCTKSPVSRDRRILTYCLFSVVLAALVVKWAQPSRARVIASPQEWGASWRGRAAASNTES